MTTEYVFYIEIHNSQLSPAKYKDVLNLLDSSKTFLGQAWQDIEFINHFSASMKFFVDLKQGDAELEDYINKANEEIYSIFGSHTELYYRIINLDAADSSEYEFDEYHPGQEAA